MNNKKSWIIIGTTITITEDKELAVFYGKIFPRLLSEVNRTTNTNRFVGFNKFLPDGNMECFIGLETDQTNDIPAGMSQWKFDDNHVAITTGNVTQAIPLAWQWKNTSDNGRITGEFHLDNAPSGIYRMSANAYAAQKNNGNDDILLSDYNPSWPKQYQYMALWLQQKLGSDCLLRLEHYGSTAIPGIPAKPVIDILMEVPSFDAVRPQIIPALNDELWEYWWYVDHMIFIRREALSGRRTHHLHLAPAGHRLWEGIAFRDHLRHHPETAEQYAALKRELSERFSNDREAYTNAKTAFVRKITDLALKIN